MKINKYLLSLAMSAVICASLAMSQINVSAAELELNPEATKVATLESISLTTGNDDPDTATDSSDNGSDNSGNNSNSSDSSDGELEYEFEEDDSSDDDDSATDTNTGNNSGNTSNNNTGNNSNNNTNNNTGNNSNTTSTLSSDCTLKSLEISSGSLDPVFSPNTIRYSASVGEDVTSITISATTNSSKASVEAISGNENLVPGENLLAVKVRAEDGSSMMYYIVVNKAGEADGAAEDAEDDGLLHFNFNGRELYYNSEIPEEIIPAGFSHNVLTVRGEVRNVLLSNGGVLGLLYLGDADGANSALYVYDVSRDIVYPCVIIRSGEHFIIPIYLDNESSPKDYSDVSLALSDGIPFAAGQMEGTGYYLLYAFNDAESINWYLYDGESTSFVKYNDSLSTSESNEFDDDDVSESSSPLDADKITKLEKELNRVYIVCGIVIVILLLFIFAVITAVIKKKQAEEDDDDDFDKGNRRVQTRRVESVVEEENIQDIIEEDNHEEENSDDIENLLVNEAIKEMNETEENLEKVNLEQSDMYDRIKTAHEMSAEEKEFNDLFINAQKLLKEAMDANDSSDRN